MLAALAQTALALSALSASNTPHMHVSVHEACGGKGGKGMHCNPLHLSLARRLGKPEGGQGEQGEQGGQGEQGRGTRGARAEVGVGRVLDPLHLSLARRQGGQGRPGEQGGRGERGGRGPEVGVWACIHLSLCRLGALENNKG